MNRKYGMGHPLGSLGLLAESVGWHCARDARNDRMANVVLEKESGRKRIEGTTLNSRSDVGEDYSDKRKAVDRC